MINEDNDLETKMKNIRIVSIGHACQVSFHIREIGLSKETEFFDWLITDFSSLHYLLNSKDDIFDDDNFTDQPVFKSGKTWSKRQKIEHKKFKMISIHDYPLNIPWNEINEKKKFIDKYTRRWKRFKNNFAKFKDNKLVCVFDHQFTDLYIPLKEEVNNVLNKLSELSNGNKIQIHFISVPELYTNSKILDFERMVNQLDKCYFHILKNEKNTKSKGWIDKHLNWNHLLLKIINTV